MDNNADLLVELGCEELPPKTLPRLAKAFFDHACKGLDQTGLSFDADQSRFFYSPRRLAFRIAGLQARQPDQSLERKGPAVSAAFDGDGNPTPAAMGFARSVGMAVEDLDRMSTDKGEWLFCRVDNPGKPLDELLFPVLEKALSNLPVAKPMRWSDHDFSFVRPAHWLVVMHGDRVIEGALLGKQASNLTFGHRIHGPGPHILADAGSYEATLESHRVIVDQDIRRDRIRSIATTAGENAGGRTRITDSLLEEVSNIVEWPMAIECGFDSEFLEVPAEALIASMEDHQKFFPVLNKDTGELTERFIVITNIESKDPDAVSSGFERVIRPRLADAQFFWEQDNKTPLEARVDALDAVLFQKSLGSVGDKSKRLSSISKEIADITDNDSDAAGRAAALCKCDLITQMVGEFPELQGVMGGYYASHSGESDDVATAIREHYSPKFAGDAVPGSSAGAVLALADRLDTLVGIFAAGLKPSGNKDPFALRRAALGAGRILIEHDMSITLDDALASTSAALQSQLAVAPETVDQARGFLLERLKHWFVDQGHPTQVVNAVFAASLTTLSDLAKRVEATSGFMQLEAASTLVEANKRISNILKSAEEDFSRNIDDKLLVIDAEKHLFDEVSSLEKSLNPLFESGEYSEALDLLAGAKGAVEAFFDGVMVMDEDAAVRHNRLGLLRRLKDLFDRVADLAMAV